MQEQVGYLTVAPGAFPDRAHNQWLGRSGRLTLPSRGDEMKSGALPQSPGRGRRSIETDGQRCATAGMEREVGG